MSRACLVLLAIVACACTAPSATVAPGGSSSATTPAPGATGAACVGDAPAEELATARASIDAADLADDATIAPIQAIRFTPAGTLASCQRLAEGVDGDALWAAAWVYATDGTDPAPLMPLLGSDDPTIRAIAAAGLTSLGRPEGLDALAHLIPDDAGLRGSRPPQTVAQFAAATLARTTGAPVGSIATRTAEERTAAAAAWTGWLDENAARLTFDAEQRSWVLR